MAKSFWGGGLVDRGYPEDPDQLMQWRRLTGRLAIDWKPKLSFTSDTLVYASYSRGYKAGGANPRGSGYNPELSNYVVPSGNFGPEGVNAFEIGTKNQFDGGKIMLNASAFYYDYSKFQISEILDRGIYTENFNARSLGLELEAAWIPSRHFRIGGTLGYLDTRLGRHQSSIDVMDRLQGHGDDWVQMQPWPTSPSVCIAPKDQVMKYINSDTYGQPPPDGWKPGDRPTPGGFIFERLFCQSPATFDGGFKPGSSLSNQTGVTYDPLDPSVPNHGDGFGAQVGGHQLPNSPHLTFNIGAEYTFFLDKWRLSLRGDYYRQSSSFARIYNTDYDHLKGWGNANFAITLSRPASQLQIQAYVKNVFNDTPITDAFTGPDELGNFTNVFTLDPRIFGLNAKIGF
jgi:iron complex outermembrane recepter protein